MKAWLQAEAESRVERAQNHRMAFRNTCMLLESRCSEYGFLAHDTTWLGPATVLAQEKGRSQEQHEEAHGTARSTHAMCT